MADAKEEHPQTTPAADSTPHTSPPETAQKEHAEVKPTETKEEPKVEPKAEAKAAETKPTETKEEPKVEPQAEAKAAEPKAAEPKAPEPKAFTIVKDVGVCADRNARHRRFMEDAHTVEANLTGDNKNGFFGVYDGHGGKTAALYCQAHLHKFLTEELQALPQDANREQTAEALRKAFSKTDASMKETVPSAGACVVVSLLRQEGDKRVLYTANAGDARAVLSRKGVAQRLTIDHKPTNEDEAERITKVGGFISNGRVNGMVAITRSLGDHCMKDYISGEPNLEVVELTADDDFLILACDGVWDVISDQEAIEMIKTEADCAAMSKKLLVSAIKGGSTDNISVMVVAL
eukprot:TRINITY_DN68_c0_g1_i2.p1 TRINITY_DN68_c0_g1~~TRINITY_DN68_c0_g1_i2.p1  ORF type:complete len:348 (-),score=86.50 TRINITY_DN68_c0_g1_i2:157-1200(-)